MASHGSDDHYHPVDAVKTGIQGAMVTGAAGLFAAGIRNATRKQNVGALGVFTKSGGMILTFSTRPSTLPSTPPLRGLGLLLEGALLTLFLLI